MQIFLESLAEYAAPSSFAYKITGFINATWLLTPDGNGTLIRWTYQFSDCASIMRPLFMPVTLQPARARPSRPKGRKPGAAPRRLRAAVEDELGHCAVGTGLCRLAVTHSAGRALYGRTRCLRVALSAFSLGTDLLVGHGHSFRYFILPARGFAGALVLRLSAGRGGCAGAGRHRVRFGWDCIPWWPRARSATSTGPSKLTRGCACSATVRRSATGRRRARRPSRSGRSAGSPAHDRRA